MRRRSHYLDGGGEYLFVKGDLDPEVTPPTNIPYITSETDNAIYFMVAKGMDLPEHMVMQAVPELAAKSLRDSEAYMPEEDEWPDEAEINRALRSHNTAMSDARRTREAKEQLYRDTLLFVGARNVPENEPMLIDGLVRERGVSVVYGAFDEFKTTLVLDMVAHVAYGIPWQGRMVMPRPVIWYALEGEDELPKRVQALEASMGFGKGSVWGEGHAPIIVRDRMPKTGEEWRREIALINRQLNDHLRAREQLGFFPEPDGSRAPNMVPAYPEFIADEGEYAPIIVVDTLSLALGDEDEKGPKAAGFITDSIELLKERPDLKPPKDHFVDEHGMVFEKWSRENGDIEFPVASHVIIIAHQTKTGIDFAGHRAIAANSQALYRVHRFGKMSDVERPYSGLLTPQRVKGVPRPAPIRFEVDVVPVEGTKQTAVILKTKAKAIPKKLNPIVDALRELDDHEEISADDVNACLDEVATNRTARSRYRKDLEAAGFLEPVEDDYGKVAFYRFHDTGTV